MWIRSQDKLCLMKVEALLILNHDKDDNNIWSIIGIGNFQYKLGEYKSKEKTIEILKKIQVRIINSQLVALEEKGKARADAYANDELKWFYQMPEE